PLAFLVRRTRCLQEPGGDESTGEKGRDEESWTLSRHVLEIGSHAVRVSIANPRAHAVEAVGEVIDPIGGVLFPLVPQPLGGVVRCSSDRANLVHRTVLIALESLNALILQALSSARDALLRLFLRFPRLASDVARALGSPSLSALLSA